MIKKIFPTVSGTGQAEKMLALAERSISRDVLHLPSLMIIAPAALHPRWDQILNGRSDQELQPVLVTPQKVMKRDLHRLEFSLVLVDELGGPRLEFYRALHTQVPVKVWVRVSYWYLPGLLSALTGVELEKL